MAVLLIGYARCSTDQQDLTAQRDGLAALGVGVNRVYVDHGLTGTNRERLHTSLGGLPHVQPEPVSNVRGQYSWHLPWRYETARERAESGADDGIVRRPLRRKSAADEVGRPVPSFCQRFPCGPGSFARVGNSRVKLVGTSGRWK